MWRFELLFPRYWANALVANVVPVAILGDLEAVLLGELRVLLIAARLLERRRSLLVVDVADPLQEQQREHVCLEVRRVDRAAQDVRCVPEHRFQ